jgi:hypothetical protein
MKIEKEFKINMNREPGALVDQLIETLVKANETGYSTLEMGAYVSQIHGAEDEHWCGTAACVCGYEAMARASSPNIAKSVLDLGSSMIARELKEVIGFHLGRSIYDSAKQRRKESATLSERFSDEELSHPHLNLHSPSMEDAISYLELVRSKL